MNRDYHNCTMPNYPSKYNEIQFIYEEIKIIKCNIKYNNDCHWTSIYIIYIPTLSSTDKLVTYQTDLSF